MGKEWMIPTLGSLLCWGFWGFIPKLTTQYIHPKSAIIYEVIGAVILGTFVLININFQIETNPRGIILATSTGMLGFLGAFCFLNAVFKGPVTLVTSLSALYPLISVILAIFILNEPLTIKQIIGVAFAILAMILITA